MMHSMCVAGQYLPWLEVMEELYMSQRPRLLTRGAATATAKTTDRRKSDINV